MTIFDVIRYPISDRIIADELRPLPPDLLLSWKEAVKIVPTAPVSSIENWYESNSVKHIMEQDIKILRQMIAEYNT